MDGLGRLAREISVVRARIVSGLASRRAHPSYGYTKASLRADLNLLTGLISGHMIASGAWDKPGDPAIATTEYATSTFGIDLAGLRRTVDTS